MRQIEGPMVFTGTWGRAGKLAALREKAEGRFGTVIGGATNNAFFNLAKRAFGKNRADQSKSEALLQNAKECVPETQCEP